MEALYAYTTTSLAEIPEDLFEVILGVRQGGQESPPLYNLFMDYIMRFTHRVMQDEKYNFLETELSHTILSNDEKQNQFG